jgi:type IV secretion system coupling TraD/TrwB family protein
VPIDFQFDPHRTVLGTVFTRAGEETFALTQEDRLKHVLAIGKTGMGKTTLLKNMALQDMHTGRGLGVIDPHGDLSRELLDEIPSWRARDLVYINPSDQERTVTFNILASVPPERIAATAADVLATFKAVWGEVGWGARMERILYASIAALIEAPSTTLLGLPLFLKDATYRRKVLTHVSDPIIRGFFIDEYATWDDNYRTTAIDPVLNKIEQLLSAPAVRATVGTVTSSIDFSEIMDDKKILIANLSKGVLGTGHAQLLGSILVSGFSHAAMARASIDERVRTRVPFFLFADEIQNFATDSFGEIASEARKMKLGLVLGHQYLEQLPHRLRAAILGNVGSIVAFQLSGSDGDTIAAEIGLKAGEMLANLGPREVWAKHATYGGPYTPRLLPPIRTRASGRDAALKQHRLRNTYPRRKVEEKITRFLNRERGDAL